MYVCVDVRSSLRWSSTAGGGIVSLWTKAACQNSKCKLKAVSGDMAWAKC